MSRRPLATVPTRTHHKLLSLSFFSAKSKKNLKKLNQRTRIALRINFNLINQSNHHKRFTIRYVFLLSKILPFDPPHPHSLFSTPFVLTVLHSNSSTLNADCTLRCTPAAPSVTTADEGREKDASEKSNRDLWAL